MTPAEVAEQLALFVAPTAVTELRALHVGERGRTFAGWFEGTRLHEMARQALALSRQAAGVYFVPNPIDPAIAAKRLNTVLNVPRGCGSAAPIRRRIRGSRNSSRRWERMSIPASVPARKHCAS